MDFAAFERLVLEVLFETRDPLTAPHLAYLGGISVARAERYLGRMAEEGSIVPRLSAHGVVEYVFPGRRNLDVRARDARRRHGASPGLHESVEGAHNGAGAEGAEDLAAEAVSSATAVLLSVLVPGAGHIYAGRSGAGVAWMATTLAGYACCLLPGLFLHGLCLVSAAHARESHQSSRQDRTEAGS
jgi:hypothetical protein